MAAAILLRLEVATGLVTLACLLLLAMRHRLRRRLGAENAYRLWTVPPLLAACAFWPRHLVLVPVRAAAHGASAASVLATHAGALPVTDHAPAIVAAWLIGVAACAALQLAQQRRFVRRLGRLGAGPAPDILVSARTDAGPLLLGLRDARIVLPSDFCTRYTLAEQAAVLGHERAHRDRGDLWANLAGAVMRALFWFHPLAPTVLGCLRADQELACDAFVLRRDRLSPRLYGGALLKCATTAPSLPVGCAMQATSTLKERIMNLQQPAARPALATLVRLSIATGALGAAAVAWAATADYAPAPAAGAATVHLRADVRLDGGAPRHQDVGGSGSLKLTGLQYEDGQPCAIGIDPARLAGGSVDLRLEVACAGHAIAHPILRTRIGAPATMRENGVGADGVRYSVEVTLTVLPD